MIKMPKRAKRDSDAMKGRPITSEEFERMLAKCKAVGDRLEEEHRPAAIASWRFYLQGIWHSGLRREESLDLHWTDSSHLCVEGLDCDRPMIRIPGDKEKGNHERVLPMAPAVAEFLREVPHSKRRGYVFNPLHGA